MANEGQQPVTFAKYFKDSIVTFNTVLSDYLSPDVLFYHLSLDRMKKEDGKNNIRYLFQPLSSLAYPFMYLTCILLDIPRPFIFLAYPILLPLVSTLMVLEAGSKIIAFAIQAVATIFTALFAPVTYPLSKLFGKEKEQVKHELNVTSSKESPKADTPPTDKAVLKSLDSWTRRGFMDEEEEKLREVFITEQGEDFGGENLGEGRSAERI